MHCFFHLSFIKQRKENGAATVPGNGFVLGGPGSVEIGAGGEEIGGRSATLALLAVPENVRFAQLEAVARSVDERIHARAANGNFMQIEKRKKEQKPVSSLHLARFPQASLSYSYLLENWGRRMISRRGRMLMKTRFTHGDMVCVCGDRKWMFSTTTVTQILQQINQSNHSFVFIIAKCAHPGNPRNSGAEQCAIFSLVNDNLIFV